MDWDTVELINDKDAEIEGLKEQNAHLQARLDREIKINKLRKSALLLALYIINNPNCNDAFQELFKILNEINQEEF